MKMLQRPANPVDQPRDATDENIVVSKVYRRLVWFLILLFVFSYLDRGNINFAALAMNKDIGLSATTFGFANSVFYIAYVFAEIPSNLMMARFGARIWIPRIMITWGVASAGTILAVGPNSLYVLRALTGLAEAGFLPGVLLYLTYWFPSSYRGRATAFFIMAQPITMMIGYPISGLILDVDGLLGLAGWQWLFLLEGLPSVALGIVAYFYLSDGPAQAKWLSEKERHVLMRALSHDELSPISNGPIKPKKTLLGELTSVPVALLALSYLGLVISLVSNATWVPQIIRAVSDGHSYVVTGLIAAVPSLGAILTMPYWGRRSDRLQERRWHAALPMALAAYGWGIVALVASPTGKLVGLVLSAVGTFAAQGIFWTLPVRFLSADARPAGIALINTIGLLGSAAAPLVVGYLKDQTSTFAAGLMFVSASVFMGSLCIIVLPSDRQV